MHSNNYYDGKAIINILLNAKGSYVQLQRTTRFN